MNKFTIVALLFFAGSLNAAPITWTFNNVLFDDGGKLSGSFVYDVNTGSYSSIAITTDFVHLGSAFTYTGKNVIYFNQSGIEEPLSNADALGMTLAAGYISCFGCIAHNELELAYDAPLTNAGGVVSLLPGLSVEVSYVDAGFIYTSSRSLVSGTLTAVPVPAALWLFGSALAGLGWLRRQKIA